jgi:phosphate starvation-inducible PhoH-like protein
MADSVAHHFHEAIGFQFRYNEDVVLFLGVFMASSPDAARTDTTSSSGNSINIVFDNTTVLPLLFGNDDIHLAKLEKAFSVQLASRGNVLAIKGENPATVEACKQVVQALYAKLQKTGDLSLGQVEAEIRMSASSPAPAGTAQRTGRRPVGDAQIRTLKKTIQPYSHPQAGYIQALYDHELVFALGPAGTGKTYIAVAMAVNMLINRQVERIILSRPAVEAGEKLGFLPGDLKDKIDPYLRPLYDALFDMMPAEKVERHMESGEIEVAPLAFMRGRTLSNAFVILDEAQNSTATQMKMFLTRMGENSRMVVTGDLSQCDLPRDIKSGLADAVKKIENIEGIATVRFGDSDVVRHDLAAKIVKAYDAWDKATAKNRRSSGAEEDA